MKRMQFPNILKVKIDSPADGQQVPTGNLQITGNSTDDAQTNCVISVALNRKTPYQTTMATGPAGGGSDTLVGHSHLIQVMLP